MKTVIDFNRKWLFSAKEKDGEKTVSDTVLTLPFFHSVSTMPEGTFTAVWTPEEKDEGNTAYIEFSQISGEVTVFCDGKEVYTHKSIQTPFTVPLALDVKAGKDYEIKVSVTPLDRGDGMFCFASASVITAGSSHFTVTDKGKGLYVKPRLHENTGVISIETEVTRPNNYDVVSYTVTDMKGVEIISATEKPTAPSITLEIPAPEIWDGQNGAYLYTLRAQLLRDSSVLDEIVTSFGFREASFGADGFFWLNGFRLPLNGIKLSDLHSLKTDLRNTVRLDCNALMIGLLPSKTDILSFCDKEGILLWYCLPYSGDNNKDEEALREFLLLYRNSPSLAFIVFDEKADNDYFEKMKCIVNTLAPDVICAVSRDIDKASGNIPVSAPLTVLTLSSDDSPEAYIAFNGRFRELQEKYPDKLFAIFAKSPEKTSMSPEKYLERQIRLWQSFSRQRNIVAYFPGNLSDGKEPSSGRGLVSDSRTALYDAFWFCKSQFSSDGFIKIATPEEYETLSKTVDIKCITNRSNLRMLVNGKDKKYKAEKASDGIYIFRGIKLSKDENVIEVSADDECDSITLFRI